MAEVQLVRIKGVYGALKGIHQELPKSNESSMVHSEIVCTINNEIDELVRVSQTDYGRYKIGENDRWNGNRLYYDLNIVRTRLGSLLSRLGTEYDIELINNRSEIPLIVTVNQNQQMSLTVIPITELINKQDDEDVKKLLKALVDSVQKKDEKSSKNIVKELADKSWQVFLQVLPFILEHWGK